MNDMSGALYLDFIVHFLVDLVALLILAVMLYYRRHRRRDLLTCIVCFNVSLLVVVAVIDIRGTSLGVGFGLFALLSIISLRSVPFSTIELGYFFSGLVISVVNGLEIDGGLGTLLGELFSVMLTATVLVVVWLVDSPRLQHTQLHQQIVLDRVHVSPSALQADLEDRLSAEVSTTTVLHTDYVRQTMLVDVRYEPRS